MSKVQVTERAKTLGRLQFTLLLILGIVIGELVALWSFSLPIDQLIAERTPTRPAVTAAESQFDAAMADRVRLDIAVDKARMEHDKAVFLANCEVNPRPGCPLDGRVTGSPGAGSETDAARKARDRAAKDLDSAIAARDEQGPRIDARLDDAREEITAAKAEAPAASSSFGARWMALNSYSLSHLGALALRVLLIALFVVVCVAPLLFLRWRNETAAKRLARAEADADAEIAIKKAEMRAEAEKLKADQELEKAKIAAEADLFLEHEKQRRRVATELGDEPPKALKHSSETAGQLVLPAAESSWLPSPLQGIANLASSVMSAPARVAQTVVEEFEELTFTITRKRKVTVTPNEDQPQLSADSPLVIDAEIVDELDSPQRRELPRGL